MAYNYTGTFQKLNSPIQDIASKTEQELRAKGIANPEQQVQSLIDSYRTPQYSQDGSTIANPSSSYQPYIPQSNAPVQETIDIDKIREDMIKQRQVQVDAINSVYSNLRQQEAVRQAEAKKVAMGMSRATQARGGLLGSTFGQAQTGETISKADYAAKSADELLAAKQNSEIQAIYGDIDNQAIKMAEAKSALAKGNLEAYNAKLTEARTQAQNLLGFSAKSGKTFDEYRAMLGEEKFRELLTNAGLDETAARGLFDSNKPQVETTKPVEVGGALVDPVTGKVVYQSPGKTDTGFKFVSATRYQPAGYFNETTGEFKPINETPTPTPSTTTPPPPSPSFDEKQAIIDMRNQLSTVVGADGFVSPQSYTTARNAWIEKGGNPTTFDTKFKGFRNPNNSNYNVVKTPTPKSTSSLTELGETAKKTWWQTLLGI